MDEDYLAISGIQHFCFCRRQWALIHIEQQWQENIHTMEGTIMHDRAHQSGLREKRNGLITVRGMPVHSSDLKVYGVCDVVEFKQSNHGISLLSEEGLWDVIPVEYKKGSSKSTDADRLQLCLQAICLEEMMCCVISCGYLFYGETKRREKVELTDELRDTVKKMIAEMQEYYARGYTPKVQHFVACRSCSLKDICISSLPKAMNPLTYIQAHLKEEEEL